MDTDVIGELTVGECFLIDRRRKGLNQRKYSEILNISRNDYGRLERDSADGKSDIFCPPDVLPISKLERCLIRRRRTGWTQEECAKIMNVTRFWFNQMETGEVTYNSLIDFWEN